MSVLGLFAALLALFAQAHPVAADFRTCILTGSSVVAPGSFIGKECSAPDGERLYAGFLWTGNTASLETGP